MPKSKKRSTVSKSKSKLSFKRKHPTPEMKSRLKKVKGKSRKNKLDKALEANSTLYVNLSGIFGGNIVKIRNSKIQEAKEMNLKYVMTEDEEYINIYDTKTKKQIKDKALSDKLSKIHNENRK